MLQRIVLAVTGLFLGLSAAAAPQPIDSIVAVVNDDVILQSELDTAVTQIRRQYRGRGNLPPDSVLERQVLERQIMQELQLQFAKQNGVNVPEEDVNQALQRMAQQNNLTVPQLRQSVERDGYDFAAFRENMRNQLIIERVQQQVTQQRVDVAPSEIDIQLERDPRDKREYRLANILVGVPDGASPAEIEQAKAEAERIRRELQNGADFQQMAIAESDSQDALEGGDIGWRRPGEIAPEFAEVLERMEPGDISRPLRSPAGFYLIKLVEERAAQPMIVPEKRARHILIQPDELMSDQEAYEKIRELRQQIVEGEADFGDLAREHSDDPVTSSKGGDLGWFGPREYGTRIDERLSNLDPGQISQPFRTEGGWHIIELLDTRRADRTDDMRRQKAEQSIRQRKSQEEVENWVRELRSRAYVDIRLDGA